MRYIMFNRLTTIAYKTTLATAWQDKVDEAICELQGTTNYEKKATLGDIWADSNGVEWVRTTWWQCDTAQLGGGSISNVMEALDIKIPKPFRDDIIVFSGSPEDRGWTKP